MTKLSFIFYPIITKKIKWYIAKIFFQSTGIFIVIYSFTFKLILFSRSFISYISGYVIQFTITMLKISLFLSNISRSIFVNFINELKLYNISRNFVILLIINSWITIKKIWNFGRYIWRRSIIQCKLRFNR